MYVEKKAIKTKLKNAMVTVKNHVKHIWYSHIVVWKYLLEFLSDCLKYSMRKYSANFISKICKKHQTSQTLYRNLFGTIYSVYVCDDGIKSNQMLLCFDIFFAYFFIFLTLLLKQTCRIANEIFEYALNVNVLEAVEWNSLKRKFNMLKMAGQFFFHIKIYKYHHK